MKKNQTRKGGERALLSSVAWSGSASISHDF